MNSTREIQELTVIIMHIDTNNMSRGIRVFVFKYHKFFRVEKNYDLDIKHHLKM